jgi:hypothetical protein
MKVLSFIAAVAFLAASSAAHAESLVFSHAATVYADVNGVPLKAPEGVACTDSGRFVVADTGNARLLVYTAKDGKVVGGTEIKLPQLQYRCASRSTRRERPRVRQQDPPDREGGRQRRVRWEPRAPGAAAS